MISDGQLSSRIHGVKPTWKIREGGFAANEAGAGNGDSFLRSSSS
jgi:hypothetical protein